MNPKPKLSFEAFSATLEARGYTPDAQKLHDLYAVLHTVEALQERVRNPSITMASEPSHIFTEPAVNNPRGDNQ